MRLDKKSAQFLCFHTLTSSEFGRITSELKCVITDYSYDPEGRVVTFTDDAHLGIPVVVTEVQQYEGMLGHYDKYQCVSKSSEALDRWQAAAKLILDHSYDSERDVYEQYEEMLKRQYA